MAIVYYRTHQEDAEGTSIFVCSLENPLKPGRVKKWFRVCGRIESVNVGHFSKSNKAKRKKAGDLIYFAIVKYKKKHSVRRAMDNDWLNKKVGELYTSGNKMEIE